MIATRWATADRIRVTIQLIAHRCEERIFYLAFSINSPIHSQDLTSANFFRGPIPSCMSTSFGPSKSWKTTFWQKIRSMEPTNTEECAKRYLEKSTFLGRWKWTSHKNIFCNLCSIMSHINSILYFCIWHKNQGVIYIESQIGDSRDSLYVDRWKLFDTLWFWGFSQQWNIESFFISTNISTFS